MSRGGKFWDANKQGRRRGHTRCSAEGAHCRVAGDGAEEVAVEDVEDGIVRELRLGHLGVRVNKTQHRAAVGTAAPSEIRRQQVGGGSRRRTSSTASHATSTCGPRRLPVGSPAAGAVPLAPHVRCASVRAATRASAGVSKTTAARP